MGQAYIPSMDMIRKLFVQNLFQISSKIPEMLQRNKPKAFCVLTISALRVGHCVYLQTEPEKVARRLFLLPAGMPASEKDDSRTRSSGVRAQVSASLPPPAAARAGCSRLTLPPSLPAPSPAGKGLLGFPKHVICSATARHCSSQAGSAPQAGRAGAGWTCEGERRNRNARRVAAGEKPGDVCAAGRREWSLFPPPLKSAAVWGAVSHLPLSVSCAGKETR